ncbi:peptidoglycan-binding domain-containing protein [Dyella sp.]|uniref:peptidoglycan-binding domain-containing protein n=1 Tax=Dyella sp. TaxID=1869338 RepID=UPI002B46165E|nr:peptidoglycan-binding domain-containing protein [Dyella sp.]HKT28111.1 peptidoglycan-binding domain-containing protein [Dyella sp.]
MSDGLVKRLIQAEGKVRVFEMDDGSVVERGGGSVSWRNNNPGNLKFEYAESADKTVRTRWTKDDALARAQRQYEGIVDLDQWGNAIFESYEAGRAAKIQLLRRNHSERNVESMLESYSRADYSGAVNHKAQAEFIYAEGTRQGVELSNKTIGSMTDAEISALADGIKGFEGWRVGDTRAIGMGYERASFREHSREAEVTLNKGTKSEAVKALQSDLATLGYTDNRGRVLQVDGHYGPSTEAAVRAFQGEYGLSVDGIAGKHTLQAIHGQRSLLGVVPAFAPELDGRYPVQVEALDTAHHMQAPARNPFANPSHPDHGLYAELKERIPDASENRLIQLAAACHMAGIKPGHLQDIHIGKQGILMTSDNLSVPPIVVDIANPAPPVEQSVQQMQAYDHQCAIGAQMRTQELAQAHIQQGPTMGGPHR